MTHLELARQVVEFQKTVHAGQSLAAEAAQLLNEYHIQDGFVPEECTMEDCPTCRVILALNQIAGEVAAMKGTIA